MNFVTEINALPISAAKITFFEPEAMVLILLLISPDSYGSLACLKEK